MSKRHLLICAVIALASFTWACGGTPFHKDSTLNKNWGRSFESAKYNQILNHGAADNRQPVIGLDGVAAQSSQDAYRRRFTADTPPPASNIKLDGVGEIGGDR